MTTENLESKIEPFTDLLEPQTDAVMVYAIGNDTPHTVGVDVRGNIAMLATSIADTMTRNDDFAQIILHAIAEFAIRTSKPIKININ